jgi:hypothetical protein
LFAPILLSFLFFVPIEYLRSGDDSLDRLGIIQEGMKLQQPSQTHPLLIEEDQTPRKAKTCRQLPFILWFAPFLLAMLALHVLFKFNAHDERLAIEKKIG